MSSHYVYAIVNKINLKLYFGSHSWDGEGLDKNYYGSGTAIKRAVRKYGKDNFIVYPIKFYDTIEECRQAEEQLLNKYNIADNPYCYNLKNAAVGWTSEDMKGKKNPQYGKRGKDSPNYGKRGKDSHMYGKRGKDSPMYGKHHTEETRKKISQATKGENNPMYGKTHTEEAKKKMSQATKGEKHPFYGKTHTEEAKKKMSQATKGENNPMYGRTHSESTRNKMSQAHGGKPFVAIKDGKVKIFTSQAECGRVLGLHNQSINQCLKGRLKSTGGYTFKYTEQLESGIYEGML